MINDGAAANRDPKEYLTRLSYKPVAIGLAPTFAYRYNPKGFALTHGFDQSWHAVVEHQPEHVTDPVWRYPCGDGWRNRHDLTIPEKERCRLHTENHNYFCKHGDAAEVHSLALAERQRVISIMAVNAGILPKANHPDPEPADEEAKGASTALFNSALQSPNRVIGYNTARCTPAAGGGFPSFSLPGLDQNQFTALSANAFQQAINTGSLSLGGGNNKAKQGKTTGRPSMLELQNALLSTAANSAGVGVYPHELGDYQATQHVLGASKVKRAHNMHAHPQNTTPFNSSWANELV